MYAPRDGGWISFAIGSRSRPVFGALTNQATPSIPRPVAVLLKPVHRMLHFLGFLFGSVNFPLFLPDLPVETKAARVECSKTSRTPSFVRAEHSRYL